MPITKSISSLSNVKQLTGADSPQNPASLVTYTYGPAQSTLGQTVINLGFSVSTTNVANFFLWVDGKLLSLGSGNDYTFTSIQSNGTSSQVTLNEPLAANLNINASYLGVLVPNAASTSILTINAALAALNGYSLKTANYALLSTDVIVQFNCSSGSLVATLPSAASVTVGQRYEITRAADANITNTLTVNTVSAQTISTRASGSIHLSPSDYLIIVSDGANWQIAEIQESIEAAYGLGTSQAVSINSVIKYDTKVRDTHSLFSTITGLYTIPSAGQYLLTVLANGNATATIYFKRSGVSQSYILAINGSISSSGSVTWPFNAGDTVGIYTDTAATFSGPPAQGYINTFSITKVGN